MPTTIDPPPLTLSRVTAVIAALGLAFAFLPLALSVTLAMTLVGILILQGLRWPLLTDRGGVWRWLPWAIWSLALATCPIAFAVIGILYEHYSLPHGILLRATRLVDGLGYAHWGVSVVAALMVVVLTRGDYRWLAWTAIQAVGILAVLLWRWARMAMTGTHL